MRSKDCTLKQIYEELDAYREALTQCHKSIDSGIFSSIITPQLEVLDVVREVGEIQDRISLTYKIYNDIYCLISLIDEDKSILEQDIRDYGDNITWINLVCKKVGKRISEALNAATDSTR